MTFVEALSRVASDDARPQILDAWIGVPGLTIEALDAALRHRNIDAGGANSQKLVSDLSTLLSVRPLSSADWLSLAQERLIAGAPYATTLAALTMSSVTGPNEGNIMWARGLFGLSQWEMMPYEARNRAVVDLAGAIKGGIISGEDLGIAKTVLEEQSPKVRGSISEVLRERGVSATELMELGLNGHGA